MLYPGGGFIPVSSSSEIQDGSITEAKLHADVIAQLGGGASSFAELSGQISNSQVANNTFDIAKINLLVSSLAAKLEAGQAQPATQLQAQASNGNSLELSVSGSGSIYEFLILLLGGQNTTLAHLEANQSAGNYNYMQQYNRSYAAGGPTLAYQLPTYLQSGGFCVIKGIAVASGTMAMLFTDVGLIGGGIANVFCSKTISGIDGVLTHIGIKTDTANGIGAGSYIRAKRLI